MILLILYFLIIISTIKNKKLKLYLFFSNLKFCFKSNRTLRSTDVVFYLRPECEQPSSHYRADSRLIVAFLPTTEQPMRKADNCPQKIHPIFKSALKNSEKKIIVEY